MPKTGAIHLEIHTTISKRRPKAKYKAVFNANFGYFDYPKLTYLTIKTGKYRYNTPLKILILLNIYLGRYIHIQTPTYPTVFIRIISFQKNMDTRQDTQFKCSFFDQLNFLPLPNSPTTLPMSLEFDDTELLRKRRANINIMAIIDFSMLFYNGMP